MHLVLYLAVSPESGSTGAKGNRACAAPIRFIRGTRGWLRAPLSGARTANLWELGKNFLQKEDNFIQAQIAEQSRFLGRSPWLGMFLVDFPGLFYFPQVLRKTSR